MTTATSRIQPIVTMPTRVRTNDIVEVRTMLPHRMETGLRRDPQTGETVPREIVHQFVATYSGQEVFRTRLHPAIAANPFLSFFLRVTAPGQLVLEWTDDRGEVTRVRRRVTVTS